MNNEPIESNPTPNTITIRTAGGEPKKTDNHNQQRGTTRQSISSFEKYGI